MKRRLCKEVVSFRKGFICVWFPIKYRKTENWDCAKRLDQSGRVRNNPFSPFPWCNLQEQPQKASDIALSTHLFSFFSTHLLFYFLHLSLLFLSVAWFIYFTWFIYFARLAWIIRLACFTCKNVYDKRRRYQVGWKSRIKVSPQESREGTISRNRGNFNWLLWSNFFVEHNSFLVLY